MASSSSASSADHPAREHPHERPVAVVVEEEEGTDVRRRGRRRRRPRPPVAHSSDDARSSHASCVYQRIIYILKRPHPILHTYVIQNSPKLLYIRLKHQNNSKNLTRRIVPPFNAVQHSRFVSPRSIPRVANLDRLKITHKKHARNPHLIV